MSSAAHYFRLLTEYDHTSQLADWLLQTPMLLINQPLKFGGGFDVLGDFGWPAFADSAAIFFLSKKIRALRWLVLYAMGAVVIWYFSKPVLRFLDSRFACIGFIGSANDKYLVGTKLVAKICRSFCMVPWFASNIFLYALFASDLKLFDVAIGISSRQQFLDRRLIYQPVYDFINENLSETDHIFLLGEQRTYRLLRPFSSCNLFAETPLASICNQASSGE